MAIASVHEAKGKGPCLGWIPWVDGGQGGEGGCRKVKTEVNYRRLVPLASVHLDRSRNSVFRDLVPRFYARARVHRWECLRSIFSHFDCGIQWWVLG